MYYQKKNSDFKILIVDDVPKNIQVVGNILLKENYQITYTQTGIQAISMANDNDFDLILLDVMMPNMDGYEVCKILKSSNKTKNIPVIFLTAKTDNESIIKGFEVGGVDFLTKPFNAKELLARVKTQLDLKEKTELQEKANAELALKNQQITASIRYAHPLQCAFLPSQANIKKYFNDFFILNKPKDIVSGDFYWLSNKDDKTYFSVSDCTGHGVPGAFISILGITSLNEIINKYNNLSSAEILVKLREIVISSLHQAGELNQTRDGIDMAFCIYDHQTKILQFSGANNPLYIIRDNELIETKGDKMPIGIYTDERKDFSNHDFQMQKNDMIYIFSDGYIDQFGGENNKKFKSNSFKKLILEIHQKPMNEQKQILEQTIIDWMGNFEQIDDILVMGVQF